MGTNKNALVIFSGGLDSTTTLYYAVNKGFNVFTISFDYGQKHIIELDHAAAILEKNKFIKHVRLSLNNILFSMSSLTSESLIPKNRKNISESIIPTTYVPSRNLIFLSIASAFAESNNIGNIFIGVNSQDYSGYPDCRNDFIKSFQKTLKLGTKAGREGDPIKIITPLAKFSKKEIVLLAEKLKVPLELTWSCYDPILKDNKATPCGECDSCQLRKEGFRQANIQDPSI